MIAGAPGAGAEPERFVSVAIVSSALSGRTDQLTYRVPGGWDVQRGSVLWVPLNERVALAVALSIRDEPPDFETRFVLAVDPSVVVSEAQLRVAQAIARETAASYGLAISLFFPPGLERRATEYLIATGELPSSTLPAAQHQALQIVVDSGPVTPDELRKRTRRSLTTVIPSLLDAGLIERRMEIEPVARRTTSERQVRLTGDEPRAKLNLRQEAFLRELSLRSRAGRSGSDGWSPVQLVTRAAGASRETANQLERLGLIELRTVRTSARAMLESQPDQAPELTPDQQRVWGSMRALLEADESATLLLRGVTGSGKTELYLRAIAWCLREGKQAIVLAPEIALASQLVRRIAARFPEDTAILHSSLPAGERLETWLAIAAGECGVVVGPRSALFAPLKNIGLIVLDEEHEPAYKQESEPRYHARTVAERLAAEHGALVVLGSATPSLETAARATSGAIREERMSSRVNPVGGRDASLELPPVEIVDLRLELHRGNASMISESLKSAIDQALEQGEQTLLFLNRRGTATVVLCGECGHTLECPYCEIPHVYHEDRKRLICHRCDYIAPPPHRCPVCGGHLQFLGAGTQRLAQVAQATFPRARVVRWDQDSVRQRGGQERLLAQIERREHDIIVGTQMIAKGLDLPHVTVVGVALADSLLQLPDFRAAERTFQLITQVAGRAGRRRAGGRVVVQTYHPAHYAIVAAAQHNVDAFYREELEFRRRQRYPPFTRMIRFVVRRSTDDQCARESDKLVRLVAHHAAEHGIEIELLGPSPAFAYRIAGDYQWQVILKASPADLERLLNDFPSLPGWVVDVDPMSVI